MFHAIGWPEILLIVVILLLVMGPRRLPDLMRGIGQSVHEFRKSMRDLHTDENHTK